MVRRPRMLFAFSHRLVFRPSDTEMLYGLLVGHDLGPDDTTVVQL
jgi:hypothetical protein